MLPHCTKVLEKAIKNKIEQLDSSLLSYRDHQTAFKNNSSTAFNTSLVLNEMLRARVKRSQWRVFIAADISKAYDSVARTRLFGYLKLRCEMLEDAIVMNLLKSLYTEQVIRFGTESLYPSRGLLIGSLLSPLLINMYLDSLIYENETLSNMTKIQRLLAFPMMFSSWYQAKMKL